MKSLQQLLSKRSEPELKEFAAQWAIVDMPRDGWIHHRAMFMQRFDNLIAARFAWERLSRDERTLLYNILGPGGHNWIVREELAKKVRTQMSPERFEAALTSLEERLYVQEEQAKVQGERLIDSRYGYYNYGYSKNKKQPIRDVTILYVPSDISSNFYLVGKEIFELQDDPASWTLEQTLAELPPGLLNAVGSGYGWMPSYGPTQSIAKNLAGLLLQPAHLSYTLGRLQIEPSVQSALQWLYEQGGKASVQALRKQFSNLNEGQLSALLYKLTAYALAFDTFVGQERMLFIPSDVYKRLHDSRTRPRKDIPIGLVSPAEPPALTFVGDALTYNDVAFLIGTIYQQNLELTKSGTVVKRLANKILPALGGTPRSEYAGEENRYLEMLLYQMRRMGLVELRNPSLPEGKRYYAPGPELEEWANMDVLAQTRYLLSCWLTGHNWLDASGANFKPGFSFYSSEVAARGPMLGYLKRCTPGTWYTVTSLLNTIRGTDPFILHPQERGSYFRDKRRQQELEEHWEERDGELLIGMLSSSLYELGIVGLGYQDASVTRSEKRGNPDFFMLTETGATVLNELGEHETIPAPAAARNTYVPQDEFEDELEELVQVPVSAGVQARTQEKKQAKTHKREAPSPVERPRSLIVQPSFELLLMQPDLPTLYSLMPFAQINALGNVSRLTLSRASVLRGMEWGLTIDEILQLLATQSQKAIPQNVDYTLRDWAKAYRAVEISQVILLEVESEAHTNDLLASSKLKEFNPRRLGPTAIAISNSGNLQSLQRTLEKEGIVVHFSGTIITSQSQSQPKNRYYGRYY
jgi:hypothetical protein